MTWLAGSSIVTASRERFLAMNGGHSAGLLARAIAAVDSHTPLVGVWGGSRVSHFHDVDVAIIGANSLLGALSARALTRQGHTVFLGVLPGLDGMPSGLVDDPVLQAVLATASGFVDDDVAAHRWSSWADRLARHLFASADGTKLLVPSSTFAFELGRRLAGEEMVLFGSRCSLPSTEEGQDFIATAHGEARRHGRVANMIETSFRRPVVLARRVILTSFVNGFDVPQLVRDGEGVSVTWTRKHIVPLGTANRDDFRVKDAVRAMLEDIVRAASADFPGSA